jgi:2'-5' RNA ligase
MKLRVPPGPDYVSVSLFFATLPPDPIRPVIGDLCATLRRAHRLQGATISKALLHNTLAPVFDRRFSLEKNIARARRVGEEMRRPSFSVQFEWTQSFCSNAQRHPLVLGGDNGLAPLKTFRQDLREQMLRAGFMVPQSYTPHVTMMWADRCVDENPIAPIGWQVRDLVLVLSLRGFGRHYTAGRWSLH